MIFLGNFEVVSEHKWRVGFRHNLPFDAEHGLGMTQAQLEEIGVLVDTVPELDAPAGKTMEGLYYNPLTREVFYEYCDIPLTVEEKIAQMQATIDQLVLDALGV